MFGEKPLKYLQTLIKRAKIFPDRLVAGLKILALPTVVRIHLREVFITKNIPQCGIFFCQEFTRWMRTTRYSLVLGSSANELKAEA